MVDVRFAAVLYPPKWGCVEKKTEKNRFVRNFRLISPKKGD